MPSVFSDSYIFLIISSGSMLVDPVNLQLYLHEQMFTRYMFCRETEVALLCAMFVPSCLHTQPEVVNAP